MTVRVPPTASIAGRAFLAVVLTIAFYALALGIVVGLLWIPYAQWQGGRIHGRVAILCLIGAAAIVFSILPRRAKFVPPGPRIYPDEQPALWATVVDIARRTGQPVPSAAYWIVGTNAFVAKVGGFLGIGGRRVLGVGFPLVARLDARALRSVIAHEFGHFHGGDVRLGPLVYGTRSAVVRSVEVLSRVGEGSLGLFFHVLQLPFRAYAALFLGITAAVSRRQELSADALAAQLAGPAATGRALAALPGLDDAWDHYLASEVVPLLQAGRRPPLAEGFDRYLASRPTRLPSVAAIRRAEAESRYDSHPPIEERLEALGIDPRARRTVTDGAVPTPIEGLDALERDLLAGLGDSTVRAFPTIAWDRVFPDLIAPTWKATNARYGSGLRGVRADALPTRAEDLTALGRRLDPSDSRDVATCHGRAVAALGTALATALSLRGWAVECEPGAPVRLRLGADTVEPFELVLGLARGKPSAADWKARCATLGIDDVDLGVHATA